uniref:Uncharacterized protein n=1 Tax=Arion vulgaris TaxID=1028688 RepID=A0A0B7AGE1_9EUPU
MLSFKMAGTMAVALSNMAALMTSRWRKIRKTNKHKPTVWMLSINKTHNHVGIEGLLKFPKHSLANVIRKPRAYGTHIAITSRI